MITQVLMDRGALRQLHAPFVGADIAPERSTGPIGPFAVANRQLYEGVEGTQGWIALSTGPRYRLTTGFSLRFRAVREFISLPDGPVEVISIGPGDGEKDAATIEFLARAAPGRISSYWMVDISEALLQVTYAKLRSRLAGLKEPQYLPILCDIARDSFFRMLREKDFIGTRIFLFYGNTIGNMTDDVAWLRRLKSAMRPGDQLLLETRCVQGAVPVPDGDADVRKQWQFQPLRQLGAEYDPAKFTTSYETDPKSIPGTRIGKTYYTLSSPHDLNPSRVHLLTVRYYQPEMLVRYAQKRLGLRVSGSFADDDAAIFVLSR